ncbi:MAG: multiheme c-type cytochrome [Planctomycetia bacterium]
MGGSRRTVVVVIVAALAVLMLRGLLSCRRQEPPDSSAGAARNVAPPRDVLGAGSCSSSGCHAAAVEGHAAWESAYTVWASRDRHMRAYEVLHQPLARRIVAALAARDPARPHPPAHENQACLGCHATERRAAAADGVSCESCHGPAGDWLVAHTLPGWKTKGNTLGMVDLADPFACANQCGQCHVGGPPGPDGALHEVSHDLIAAGHPRLTFELRSFKAAEPPHWRDRFTAAAGAPGPLDEWALGRLGGLEAYLAQVATQSAAAEQGPVEARLSGAAGVWPEFTAFDCYGCHRPAVAPLDRGLVAFVSPAGKHLGSPRLDPMTWSLLNVILPEDAAQTLLAFRGDTEANWWRPPSQASIEDCRRAIEHARPGIAGSLTALPAAALAREVVAGTDAANWDEAVSALRALTALVDQLATTRDVSAARTQLETLRGLLEFEEGELGGRRVRFDSPQGYDAARVQAELQALAESLEQ